MSKKYEILKVYANERTCYAYFLNKFKDNKEHICVFAIKYWIIQSSQNTYDYNGVLC